MANTEPSAWKKTIIAAMTSYIDAGSIVAGAAGLSLWQAYLGMDGVQMGLLAALSVVPEKYFSTIWDYLKISHIYQHSVH